MKKFILVLGLSLVLLTVSGVDVIAQASKEISEPSTSTWHGISKVLPLGEDRNFITFEATGVFIGDEGKGLFHEATARSIGSVLIEKGVSKNYGGYFCFFLKNGDKVFVTFSAPESKAGAPMKGKTTIIGATGKSNGIQGSWDWTFYPLRPAGEGIGQSYFKHTLKYQLP
jgi:hypothetical protein